MRVAHFFSGNPNTGAASGALNLCGGLLSEGVKVNIFNDQNDFIINNNNLNYKQNIKKKIYSFRNNIFDRLVVSGSQSKIKFSSGKVGEFPINIKEINKFDLMHLHWINNGFINLQSLKYISIPIVWTIRDMWPFTGGCHYSLGCKKYYEECFQCPNIKSYIPFRDQINYLFKIKKNVLSDLKLNLVPISKWLENEIKKSKLLQNQKITQIYNCIDEKVFFPSDLIDSRKELNLPKDKFIILIGSQKLNDKLKDNSQLLNIMNKFNKDYFFVSFGRYYNSFSNMKNYGFINDKNKLRKLYSSANLYLSFAKEEAFGKTLVESLMCNTPVISNNNNSAEEIIKDKSNGYVVKDNDYYKAILWVKNNLNKNNMKINIPNPTKFSVKEISKEYINLYQSILK